MARVTAPEEINDDSEKNRNLKSNFKPAGSESTTIYAPYGYKADGSAKIISGRPPTDPEQKKLPVTISLEKWEIDELDARIAAGEGAKRSELIRKDLEVAREFRSRKGPTPSR